MFRYYASDIKNVLVSREGNDDLYERLALKRLLFGKGLDQIAQVPEVTSNGRFDKVRDAGISVVSALDYFLDLLGQTFWKVYCMIFVLTF
jgi:hypothetical protein